MFKKESFGKCERYSISVGQYSISVLSRGAILQSFKIDNNNIVLGYENIDDYIANNNYFGQVVGPFANRIANAEYEDSIGIHKLDKNDGNNNLHSGAKNYGYSNWSLASFGDEWIELYLHSNKTGGFPSSEDVHVRYTLSENGELRVDYKVDADCICPVNITNHSFFNLNCDGSDIRNHLIKIPAKHYLEVDDALIPTGIKETKDSVFDFSKLRRIGAFRDGKYDHCFVLDGDGEFLVENNNLRLSVKTDLPAVQFYSGEFITSRCKDGDDKVYSAFSGFCLETELFPNFVNKKEYPSAWIDEDSTFSSWTVYKLEKK